MKFWILFIALALFAAPSAFAHDDQSYDRDRTPPPLDSQPPDENGADENAADEKERIILLLSHHHEMPNTKQLEAASPNARDIVFDIAGDEDIFLFHRQRALRALAQWPDDDVYDFLYGLLIDEETEDGLRHHLLPTLANGFGMGALEALEPFLTGSADPQIRISAATAIAQIDDDDAQKVLLAAMDGEKNSVVRNRIESLTSQIR